MSLRFFTIISFILSAILFDSSGSINAGVHLQIFDNVAEIAEPISTRDLPKFFTQQEWSDIRTDSFRLVSPHVHIRAQIQSYNRPSTNGQRILIQRHPMNSTFTEALMIDDAQNLIHDLTDDTYYSISNDRIRYLKPPNSRNYSIHFVLDRNDTNDIYLRYLRNNIRWKVRYDLALENNESDSFLQAYADIRNDGRSPLTIDSAELISGDINIRSISTNSENRPPFGGSYPANGYTDYDDNQQMTPFATANPIISSAEELAGVYIFSINQKFFINSQSNFILPMFRPIIDIERYGLIEKSFIRMNNRGNAKRAYRLRVPEYYLPKGQVLIRESDRLVGETLWSAQPANETNQFNLGTDPDLQFFESVQLNSRRQAYEANGFRLILSTYVVQLRVVNRKDRSINIEYRLRFSSQEHLTLKENTPDNLLELDGPILMGILPTNANDQQQIEFTIETE